MGTSRINLAACARGIWVFIPHQLGFADQFFRVDAVNKNSAGAA
jgi:hypothetical protein